MPSSCELFKQNKMTSVLVSFSTKKKKSITTVLKNLCFYVANEDVTECCQHKDEINTSSFLKIQSWATNNNKIKIKLEQELITQYCGRPCQIQSLNLKTPKQEMLFPLKP